MTDVSIFQGGGYVTGGGESGQLQVHFRQLGAYAVALQKAEDLYTQQSAGVVVAASETSSGLFNLNIQQLGAYALVRGRAERQDLRCWTFTQDDHDFYVLQLGDETLVYDKLTEQWAEWVSPTFNYWRGEDGVDWEGFNVCCDTESGKIWKIDPDGRLDYETTPIRSVVTGGLTERFRKHVPCYMAELAVSESSPPEGIDATTVGITLRTYDGANQNSVSHGEVEGLATNVDITVRWYSLGLIKAPGTVFEIVDTGYARRIDGLNIEIGD
jgi:hypothetical protein